MPRRRLLWHLYPTYLLITLVSVSALSWYAVRSLKQFYIEERARELENRATLMRDLLGAELGRDAYVQMDSLVERLGREWEFRVTIIDTDGRVLADSDHDAEIMDNHAGRPEVVDALAQGRGSSIRYSHTVEREMMYVAIPTEPSDGRELIIRMATPTEAVESALRTAIGRIALGGVGVAVLATALCLFVAWRITAPIEEMKRGADRFARGEFDATLSVPNSAELGSLAEAMNRMAQQLDERIRTVVSQRNEHEALLGSMVEGVLAVDREERLLSMNAAAERVLGVPVAEAQGRSIQEAVRNVDLQKLVARTLQSETTIEGELVIRGDNLRYLQAHGSPLRDARGRNIGAVIVLNDITRIRRLETLRSDFVANVSHELKTPITSIKGFVETLLDGPTDDPEETRRFLQIIGKHADRLTSIIDDLLSLSRIEQEADRAEIPLETGEVQPVVEAAVQLCEPRAGFKRIRLVQRHQPGLKARINGALLEQAVINLVDNAIKYSASDSTVEIETRRQNSDILIEVIDHGVGIAQDHLPRLFERFYRVDKARSRKLGGTGLGLSIVKHIIQAHEGRVSVESQPGRGSRFTIALKAE